ncbi:Diguanylate cyclase (GGDEF)-like protein/PAS domain S-box-containing protein OS=Castellaniella defragrans OX=75697 GN=HNR28_000699 PE=4 SV=1 [Castellaniella defragrans]
MNALSLRASWSAWREASGLGVVSIGLFVALLVFVLGNAVAVYSQMAGYEGAIRQITTLDQVRMLSQRLAVQAMRLSDGSFIQTAGLSQDLDEVGSALRALDQGGVVAGHEVPPMASPQARDFLPQIQHYWKVLEDRLRATLLQSYTMESGAELAPSDRSRVLQREWIADDANGFLSVLTSASNVLVPQLRADQRRAVVLGLGLAAADLLILMMVFLWLQRRLVQPLRELRLTAQAWIGGNYGTRLGVQGMGELRDVARAFDAGADQLRALMNRIREEQAGLARSDIIFQGLALNALVGIFLAESDRFSFVSEKMAEIFGYEVSEMTASMPLLSIIVPRERYLVSEALKASRSRRDGTLRFERHGRCKDGSVIDIEVFGTAIQVDGKVSIIGLVQDVTERKQAESSAQLAAIAYENSSEAIAITDASGIIVDVNPAYSRMTGYWSDEVAGEMLPLLRPGRHNRDFYDEMWHAINTKGRWEGEYWGQRKSGEEYAERVVMDTAWNHDGSVNCRVVMLGDVTQKKQVEAQIWNQAHHDPLTSLPNRQYFNERLQAAVVAADQAHGSLALLFLDLDLFKEVNDSMGHAVGDQLLVEVAQRLSACAASRACFVARLGGDEFVMIVHGVQERAQVDALCEEVLACIDRPYRLGGKTLRVSASLGVALYPQDANDAESLLRNVDMAMYEAKDTSRHGGYHYFDVRMRERARIQRDLLDALPQAIEAGQFFLLYQPIYSFHTGEIERAEILLRWRHPDLGIVSPLDFIPFAEERHLIRPLSDWVFGRAARQLAEWRAISPQLRLTMNVSPGQLAEDRIDLEAVLALLRSYGLPANALSLECSEHLFLNMDAQVRARLQRMSAAGMRFSVGAVSLGMSALLAMPHQTFETLKLEREATERLLASEHAAAVCDAIVTLAHRLELSVIAEGIATRDQYEFLLRVGCDAGQGYWLDEPMEREVFEQRLRDGVHRP